MNYPQFYTSLDNYVIVRVDQSYITKIVVAKIEIPDGQLIEAETSIRKNKYTDRDLQNIRSQYTEVDSTFYIDQLTKIIGASQNELTNSLNELTKTLRDGKSITNPS